MRKWRSRYLEERSWFQFGKVLLGFTGVRSFFAKLYWIFRDFLGIFIDFVEFHWVLMGLTGFCWVFLGFAELY